MGTSVVTTMCFAGVLSKCQNRKWVYDACLVQKECVPPGVDGLPHCQPTTSTAEMYAAKTSVKLNDSAKSRISAPSTPGAMPRRASGFDLPGMCAAAAALTSAKGA